MARIVLDPVTRIEGHLRIEAQEEAKVISDAWSSGTMFRGIELIVKNRDPREAWIWLQRICSVCTTVHALASVRAVENALKIEVPRNAELVRNLIAGSQMIQDHIVHFYHLQALDWVDVTGALKADPAKTAELASSLSDWKKGGTGHFKAVQDRVKTLVESGQLSLFTAGYWGHPAYTLPPEVDLLAVSHYLDALEFQRDFIRVHAVLGGKNPHLQTYLVGGMSTAMDPNTPEAVINPERLDFLQEQFEKARGFVDQVYLPDVLAVAGFYPDWTRLGEGVGNFMSYGDLPMGSINDPARYFLPQGIIMKRDLARVYPFSPDQVSEYVTRSWYSYQGGDATGKPGFEGETNPDYTGPEPPYEFLNAEGKYSWLKAPRYGDKVMEVGPLSRVLVAYASGRQDVRSLVDSTLDRLKLAPEALFSTLGRIAARALETKLVADQMLVMLGELGRNLGDGNLRIHANELWDPATWPASARGFGHHEAPRGSLGHWVEIENRLIKNYQVTSPTTWNGGPRDALGQRGPYEAALVGTPIADPKRPLEILRTVHSFDPCLACAVHVVDARGRRFETMVPHR
jgi:Ni,Fe-hydrogenase I large subunit